MIASSVWRRYVPNAHQTVRCRSAGARGLGTPATAGGDARPGRLDMVGEARGQRARLFVPGRAEWIQTAVADADSNRSAPSLTCCCPRRGDSCGTILNSDLRLRSIRPGEDAQVLAALNRAWTAPGTSSRSPCRCCSRPGGSARGHAAGRRRVRQHPRHVPCRVRSTSHNPDGNPRAWIRT